MHNRILWTITETATLGFFFFVACLNEHATKTGLVIAGIGATVCGGWLLLFSHVNADYFEKHF